MNDAIICYVKPENINFLNRIIEGYEYLGMVSTLDRTAGKIIIRVTPDTYNDVKEILNNLPFAVSIE